MQAIVGDMIRHDIAKEIADNVVNILKPSCEKIIIAGSVRREKPYSKDIDIVCLPYKVQELGLFESYNKDINCFQFVKAVSSLGKIESGNPETGRHIKIEGVAYSNIEMEMINITIELNIPQIHDFGRILTYRTGSSEYVKQHIKRIQRRKGWVGTDDGIRLESQCINKGVDKPKWKCTRENPTLPPPFYTEESYYEFLNIPFQLPKFREV